MESGRDQEPKAVVERLHAALNAHDLDAFVDCFDEHYDSDQPAHPGRSFTGSDQVRKNWASMFTEIPDFNAELLRVSSEGDTAWAEWRWSGTRRTGGSVDMRGVTIMGVRNGRIAWGRLYMELVEQAGAGIDETVRRVTKGADQ